MNRNISLYALGFLLCGFTTAASVSPQGINDLNAWGGSQLTSNHIARKSHPWCEGVYEPTTANCKKYDFGPSSTNSCIEPKNCTTFYDIHDFKTGNQTASAIKFAELITNVFENGNTKMGYAYVQALGDGRGYTCGYIGFTTGTNDANYVVQQFNKRFPKSTVFAKYTKELERLSALPYCDNKNARNDTSGLQGFPKVWADQACHNPDFVETQLDTGRAMYVEPAMRFAAQYNVTSPLGFALFYDTIIQHGWQYTEPTINLPRILHFTGARSSFKSEYEYLQAFLKNRRQLMCCVTGDDDTWASSADRVEDLQRVLTDWTGNKDLEHPVTLKNYGVTVKGTEQINYDTAECSSKTAPKDWTLPASATVILPTSCTNTTKKRQLVHRRRRESLVS
ncbi:hypothetical protein HWV62_41444 [Athelia sp. TMB]|nr:hypothetical protein HWV62_41444 [Athelia sp. TMB]